MLKKKNVFSFFYRCEAAEQAGRQLGQAGDEIAPVDFGVVKGSRGVAKVGR